MRRNELQSQGLGPRTRFFHSKSFIGRGNANSAPLGVRLLHTSALPWHQELLKSVREHSSSLNIEMFLTLRYLTGVSDISHRILLNKCKQPEDPSPLGQKYVDEQMSGATGNPNQITS